MCKSKIKFDKIKLDENFENIFIRFTFLRRGTLFNKSFWQHQRYPADCDDINHFYLIFSTLSNGGEGEDFLDVINYNLHEKI